MAVGEKSPRKLKINACTNGRYTFASLPPDKGKAYTFRIEVRSADGALLGTSAEVTI